MSRSESCILAAHLSVISHTNYWQASDVCRPSNVTWSCTCTEVCGPSSLMQHYEDLLPAAACKPGAGASTGSVAAPPHGWRPRPCTEARCPSHEWH